MAGKAADAAMGWIADGLSLLGFEESAQGVRDFTEEIKITAAETTNLKNAQEKLASQMSLQEVNNETAKKQLDELKKKTEDQTLSEQERTDALQKAITIETENYNQRQKLAEEAYNQAVRQMALGKGLTQEELANLQKSGTAYAEKMMKVKGFSQQEVDALQKAQVEKIRIAGEESNMLQSQSNARLKIETDFEAKRAAAAQKREQQEADRLNKMKKILDDGIQKQKLNLDLYIAQQGIKVKSLDEELKMAEYVAAEKIKIARKEYDAIAKTEKDKAKVANAAIQLKITETEISNGLLRKQTDAAINNAAQVLKNEIAKNQSLRNENTFLSQDLYNAEVEKLNNIAKAQEQFQLERKNNGAINEKEYNDEITRIQAENAEAQTTLKQEREDAEKAKEATDLENKLATDTANHDYDLKFQLDKLDAMKAQELDAAEKSGADKNLIDQKYAKLKGETEKAVMANKIELAQSTFTNLATLLGKEGEAAKAMAVAQATMDTYKSAVSAYSSLSGIPVVGPALGAVAAAAAVASGIANIKKITSTKAPKAENGALFSIGGNRHSQGGTMFRGADGTAFEAEQGELIGVMNRNAARHFMAFNNAFPAGAASTPNYFAGGGIVSREIAPQGMNTDELAAKIAEANRSIPAPVVAVQDIITQGDSYVKVREGANF